ncbi:ABC-F family ATP-binding cassette domain-containing protein [Paenibacillus sacheonensis]|uniref:ATP-binding cassette domain-containing protein n=1 Tax=Paenibacillus sacheonensis TaxID=742054 RepID=A0A7X4YUH8_9BACL|nr:ATP-binding cassette domain-containing protein [Paenibacillus sacheonensis]MBM7567291.1 ATPase subunit of ABC transporter with duplicated ATPase domains [Paenibacillus sacheonensis]NBC72817.1 ATP-binding cassette domain-containing protein [Paenibacillus sacheonensis]
MISTSGITLRYGKRALFEDVNIKFTPGNCYGLIGANGAGKSTFLKILSGEVEQTSGEVHMTPGERFAVLKQNHYEYDENLVLETVIMGYKKLYEVMKEKDAIYAKAEFTDEDGMRAGELEAEFADMNGWEAESEAAGMLNGLGITPDMHDKRMAELSGNEKVRVLLAQALFGNPQILLLDEPTNHLDMQSIEWLENFLGGYEGTVIVVSHDRHFLNQVCTHIADIDFGKIQMYVGNYDFWYESSQLALTLMRDNNKKKEDKIKELQAFIQRFSANKSKSKQATSRKKLLDKISLDDIRPSNRKYPFINFKPEREAGKQLLLTEGLTKSIDGTVLIDNLTLALNKGDKVALVGPNTLPKTLLMQVLMGETEADAGTYSWGVTTTQAYFPKDNSQYFDGIELNLVDWLRQYSKDQDESFIRGFLGRMLFSGDEALKKASVLSGGEKVRCMLSKMMLSGSNVLLMDEPTNHLDLESITALNNGLIDFDGTLIFTSHDHQFVQTIANRIIEITPNGIIDRMMSYDEYLESAEVKALRERMYPAE